MSRSKRKLTTLVGIALAAPLMVVAAAGPSSAASSLTWSTGGKCLGYGINTIDTNVSSLDNVFVEDCSAPGWTSVGWVDKNVTSNIWTEHPTVNTNLCLTAYFDHSVYFENCKSNNNYERWREIHSGSNWYLQNVATGEYLNTNSYNNAVTSTYKQAWH